MPEMNGRVLAERLASQRPSLAVLRMSGYSPENVFRQGYLIEGAAYLQKPFARADLAMAVRAALDGRSGAHGHGSGSDARR
jgi:DNA-binding NarL/FixJ family response regulator